MPPPPTAATHQPGTNGVPARATTAAVTEPGGLRFRRAFAADGDPYLIPCSTRSAEIRDGAGNVIFRQENVVAPESWSDQAVRVVASKYFYGPQGKGDDPAAGGRESSVLRIVSRVVGAIADAGRSGGYFASGGDADAFGDDLAWLCLNQYAAFNSPVWFNLGLSESYGIKGSADGWAWDATSGKAERVTDSYAKPQISACFIQSVRDDMASICDLATAEMMLFRYGSGSGTDLSPLRSTRERLSGGGKPSGPVSFMRVYDAGAGVVKSGGKTRRAAKIQTLKDSHPDIFEFVDCKAKEEKKALALIAAGYSAGMTGSPDEAYGSVAFQNANLSVRASDAFLRAVESGGDWTTRAVTTGEPVETFPAASLMDRIAEGAWLCGDPGMQYHDTINRWNTVPNTAEQHSTNPCCFVGETLVQTAEGLISFHDLYQKHVTGERLPLVFSFDRRTGLPALAEINKVWVAGSTDALVEVRTQRGHVFRCTPEHRFLTHSGDYVAARDLTPGTRLRKVGITVNEQRSGRRYLNHKTTPDCPSGTEWLSRWMWEQANGPIDDGMEVHHVNEDPTDDRLSNYELIPERDHLSFHTTGAANPRYISADEVLLLETWEAVESLPKKTHKGDPLVTPTRWNAYIRANGLKGKVPFAGSPTNGGRIRGMAWSEFAGWVESRKQAANDRVDSVRPYAAPSPVAVFDMEVEGTHNFAVGSPASLAPVVVSNSEFSFINDSACNLASLNLMKFRTPGGGFDHARFRAACRVLVVAQEILVGHACYPTRAIAENSHRYRPLGLGYSNLGALLMSCGLPYDSDAGRALAGAVTSLMGGAAFRASAEVAEALGPYDGYDANRLPMLRVVSMHRDAAEELVGRCAELPPGKGRSLAERLSMAALDDWVIALKDGKRHGYRHAQLTLIPPAGTISFLMDCDTTGVEPAVALVAAKQLAGGGSLKLVNGSVGLALEALGYDSGQVENALAWLADRGSFEGYGGLDACDLPVFDAALPSGPSGRSIPWCAHLKMLAAVQPYLCGSISKTINMPADSTVADVRAAYMEGWKLGLKAVAIYRDGSKGQQPLTAFKPEGAKAEPAPAAPEPRPAPSRRRLPRDCAARRHKFAFGGHEGYIHAGLFPDGTPGEVFVTMSKDGSTVQGLMDALGTVLSIALQYGAPLGVLAEKLAYRTFEPHGPTGNPAVPVALSLADYLGRWLEHEFLVASPAAEPPDPDGLTYFALSQQAPAFATGRGSICPRCGSVMRKAGACDQCPNCFLSGGCG